MVFHRCWLLQAKAVDYLMVDLLRVGGITQFRKVAGMAQAFGVPVASHLVPEVFAHLIAAIPNDDVVILGMKTQDTLAAIDALATCAPSGMPIVGAQNGIENERPCGTPADRLKARRRRDLRHGGLRFGLLRRNKLID
ncbi:MAG TPA: enolase C-terminal domain-like protein [Caulobacteraceae bacterium]|jgi:hypothetical protein|nr:enolase C-terminal domain-like protein [Caulobacteraceae bacterium]